MNANTMTQDEIVRAGLDALLRELGSVGLVRFLQQFELGSGDYTAERHQWLDGISIDELWTGGDDRSVAAVVPGCDPRAGPVRMGD
jgi:hypothetical protein